MELFVPTYFVTVGLGLRLSNYILLISWCHNNCIFIIKLCVSGLSNTGCSSINHIMNVSLILLNWDAIWLGLLAYHRTRRKGPQTVPTLKEEIADSQDKCDINIKLILPNIICKNYKPCNKYGSTLDITYCNTCS